MTTDSHARIDLRLETRGTSDTIAWVTIDNVRKLNCLSSALMTAFVDTIEQLGRRDDLRAIVVSESEGSHVPLFDTTRIHAAAAVEYALA